MIILIAWALTLFFGMRQTGKVQPPYLMAIATVTAKEVKLSNKLEESVPNLSSILRRYQSKFQPDGKYLGFQRTDMPLPGMLAIMDYKLVNADTAIIYIVPWYTGTTIIHFVPSTVDHFDGILRVDTWKKNVDWNLVDSR